MSVIVWTGLRPYVRRMISAVLRLLTLLALVLMPLGMASAPAAASPMPATHEMASMGHCDEQPQPDQAPISKMDCTTMCAALPATDAPAPAPGMRPATPRSIVLTATFTGIEPEIATPPPKKG